MKEIGGRVAIVTGASRGLGRHIAETLFDHGLKVVVTARNEDELEAVRGSFDRTGKRSLAVPGDITVPAHRIALLDASRQKFGAIDILVNNAGNDHPEAFSDTTLERIKSMFDLNVIASMDMTRLVLPAMLERGEGHIVNMASVAGLAPVPFASSYSATKHAIVGFSQSLRFEVAEQGVGVSVVCPGFVRDDGLFHQNSGGDTSGQPTVSPQQVADAVVKAITANRDRVVVSPAIVKLTPLANGLSPSVTAVAATVSGAYDAMRGIAARLKQQEAEANGNRVAAPARRKAPGMALRRGPRAGPR
ncbi:MAG TPA: SDR family NAD(P)-dependent oxidoreductase [Candidatus Dormibacteraeota bacterium]|nr:SDR family NAD(P)-dependent oxidoreductase [Candidatus Dormibacteraeota bacterium]